MKNNNKQTLRQIKGMIASDSTLRSLMMENPEKSLTEIEERISDCPDVKRTDKWIYRGVVYSLGLAVLIIIAGVVKLMLDEHGIEDNQVPTVLTALGSAAIGALAGLLAPSPRRDDE